jgi:hypothetical protein
MKKCIRCKNEKPFSEFYNKAVGKNGKHEYCKKCSYLINRKNELKRVYGISLDEYNAMFANQKGCCAICMRHQSECSRTLAVDHCHSTGKIRKLLCHNCNNGIGNFKEDLNILKKAISYIQSFKKEHT